MTDRDLPSDPSDDDAIDRGSAREGSARDGDGEVGAIEPGLSPDAVDYREIYRKMSDGVLLHDAETGRVLDANPAMCEMTGYDREELIGRSVAAFSAGERGYSGEEARRRIRAAAEEGPQVFEWLNERRGGDRFWVEVNLRRAEFGGRDCVLAVVRNVDDRKRLENGLESLQSATEHLIHAESKEEVADRAVEAADRVLSFPMLGVHLYDDVAGVLEPVAHTDAAERVLGGEPPTIESGEGPTWTAFAAGEPAHYEDVHQLPEWEDPSTPVRSQLVLPVGSHGVIVVADPEPGGFDEEEVELAGILSANVEAAMNHAEGRRRLREREAQLQRETERAERLERLNRIVRDVEAALVEETTAEGIERAVCERVVAADPFVLAWVGTADREGRPVPSTRAGEGTIDAPGDAMPTGHPARVAVETGRTEALQELVGDAGAGEWRRRALTHGYQSVCAVPLAHGNVSHGILVVYADRPRAFDDDVRETLSELGRSIADALTSLERRRALESDVTVELEFSVSDPGLVPVALSERTDHAVSLERSIRRSSGGLSLFYAVESVDGSAVDPDRVVSAATGLTDVASAHLVNDDGDSCLLELTASDWFGASFVDRGAMVQSAQAVDGDGTVVVEAPNTASVRTLVDQFREQYPEVELVARRDGTDATRTPGELRATLEAELTDRQREVLETAYSAGYFDWPRGSSGEEVAELLDITQPTLNKHLRLAEQTAFELLLEGAVDEE